MVSLLPLLLACTGSADTAAPADCPAPRLVLSGEWTDATLLGREPPEVDGASAGVALGDVDGDGWLDALIATPEGSLALRNDGGGDLTADGRITVDGGGLPAASAVTLADLDGDGDLDAWLGRREGLSDLLLLNDGAGRFTSAPLPDSSGEHFTGSPADIDGDGDLDLFVAGYADAVDPERILDGTLTGSGNVLYRNDGAGGLSVADLPAGVIDDVTFQGAFFDPDDDGDLDLYLANDFGPFLSPNRLLLNDGAGGFSLSADCHCDVAMFCMGIAIGDLDGSGGPDLFLTDLGGPDLLLDDGAGGYYDATIAMSAAPDATERLAGWGVAAVDLDGDGWEDLPMVFGPLFPAGDPDGLSALGYDTWIDGIEQPDALLHSRGGAGFSDISQAAGFTDTGRGRALAVGDLDRDGRPDLVTAGLWFARSWRGVDGCAPGVTLRLVGEGLTAGLHARVVTEIDGDTRVRWLTPSSTWSSHAPELSIGLGGAAGIDRLTVRFSDGSERVWTDIPAGTVLELAP